MNSKTSATDHLGRVIQVERTPKRIVSLCPSHTHTLIDLGCSNQLVGVTQYCRPSADLTSRLVRIGGTKTVQIDRVLALDPDLVIAEKEEQTPEIIAALETRLPVFVTEIKSVTDGVRGVLDLGQLTGHSVQAREWESKLRNHLDAIRRPPHSQGPALYFIWKDPWMVVHQGTFIDSTLEWLGYENVAPQLCSNPATRYPEISQESLSNFLLSNPGTQILLSSEPYPFRERHRGEFLNAFPGSQVRLVDGQSFSWYGTHQLTLV